MHPKIFVAIWHKVAGFNQKSIEWLSAPYLMWCLLYKDQNGKFHYQQYFPEIFEDWESLPIGERAGMAQERYLQVKGVLYG